MGAAWVRWKTRGYQIGEAERKAGEALAQGDRAGYVHFMAIARRWETDPLSFSEGSPVPIADRRPVLPESPEEP